MKDMKILVLGLGLLVFASCKKNEITPAGLETETPAPAAAPATSNTARLSSWQSVSNWSADNSTGSAAGVIKDAAITADIANEGIVLVFAKKGNIEQSLPYMQSGDVFWNYQVEEGTIIITADGANGKAAIDTDQQFQYVVLSKEQLDALDAKGQSRNNLINLSYQTANSLFQ
jgi:hypothetical protein